MHSDETDLTDLFKDSDIELYDADPDCEHKIIAGIGGSGIRCAKCSGWFCY